MTIKRVSTGYIHSLDNNTSFGTQKSRFNNVSSGVGTAQFFTSNQTYTRPPNVNFVDLIIVGGGGGGGAGNYGGGGGGGAVFYIKKFFVGDFSSWNIIIGAGGAGGNEAGFNGQAATFGDTGGPTFFSPDVSSFTYTAYNTVGTTRTIVCPGGGGGGPAGVFGFMTGSGGGSGSGVGAGSIGRISGDQFWNPGWGFNGGAGASGGSGGGGSTISAGGNASTNIGGNGANGVNLTAPVPSTFVNSSSQTISCIFGGGGGGSGATTDGAGGSGGGGSGKNANGTPNTGGGGSGNSGNGGSGIIIVIPNGE
jgi:hypothetical protein